MRGNCIVTRLQNNSFIAEQNVLIFTVFLTIVSFCFKSRIFLHLHVFIYFIFYYFLAFPNQSSSNLRALSPANTPILTFLFIILVIILTEILIHFQSCFSKSVPRLSKMLTLPPSNILFSSPSEQDKRPPLSVLAGGCKQGAKRSLFLISGLVECGVSNCSSRNLKCGDRRIFWEELWGCKVATGRSTVWSKWHTGPEASASRVHWARLAAHIAVLVERRPGR